MSFLSLAHAWLFALLVPLVIFYFLKLKRPRLVVPSLVLWGQVMQDRRVNSPFQRFKRHLLLLLQLLLLIMLALAAIQPVWQGGSNVGSAYLPIIIDTSASMAATDADGRSRLDVAREQIAELIAEYDGRRQICLISSNRRARRLTDFTDNPRVLMAALGQLEVDDVPGDAGEGLRLAQAIGQSVPLQEVLFFSDGNVPPDADCDLAYDLDFRVLPPAAPNLGITACRSRQLVDGGWEVLVVLRAAIGPGSGSLVVRTADEELARESVAVAADDSYRLLLRLPGDLTGLVHVELRPDGDDSLMSDNDAWLDLPKQRPLRVHVTDELASWSRAIMAMDDVVAVSAAQSPDLMISEGSVVGDPWVHVSVGSIPSGIARFLERRESAGTGIADWNRSAPILRHVSFEDLAVLDSIRWKTGAQVGDLENAGYEILVDGDGGPLVLRSARDGRVTYHFLFHSDRSTLPYRVGFPVLIANAVLEARQLAGLAEVSAARTGVLQLARVTPSTSWDVTMPDGGKASALAQADGLLGGVAADRVGLYQLDGPGERRTVAAALLDDYESSLEAIKELQFNEIGVEATGGVRSGGQPLWRWFALLGLALLLGEWWFYQRRPGGW